MKLALCTGEKIHELVMEIAKLRMEIFREYPYLYEGDEKYEKKYLSKFASAKDAIVAVAYDGSEIVGISTGLPLVAALDEIKAPFVQGGHNLEEIYYFGEMMVKKKYREQGIGRQFFDLCQEHVRKLGHFKWSCFCTVKPVTATLSSQKKIF